MDRRLCFERNLLALSARNPALCSRLSGAETTLGRYRFLESRSGETVPALVDPGGAAHPLHSTVDPRREGERLVSTLGDEGFLIFMGLGAGYAIEAALERAGVSRALAIEYDIHGMAELFCSRDYIKILGDPRFTVLVDPAPAAIEACILEQYRPALAGGIRTVPLRARTEQDAARFGAAAAAIQRGIERVSADYSVQAHFGGRWFANIIRNLRAAESLHHSVPPVWEAAICAAGPSLDGHIPLLAGRRLKEPGTFIISADTALPALLAGGVQPDAVVSIDCQHFSCYHFIGALPKDIPLFLDIASPPLLAGLSRLPFFFSGGHPLARYLSRHWRPLPALDTSGGNVSYACLSLAEQLGAVRVTVYGADFSYPGGGIYARGTYVYPFFEKRQNRLVPAEAQRSALLYRAPFLPRNGENAGYYETAALRFYRECFERKAAAMSAEVVPEPGRGAPVHIHRVTPLPGGRVPAVFAPGKCRMSSADFLEQYRNAIAALPLPGAASGDYAHTLPADAGDILTTLLPLAAALKRRRPELRAGELVESVQAASIAQIDRVLAALPNNKSVGRGFPP